MQHRNHQSCLLREPSLLLLLRCGVVSVLLMLLLLCAILPSVCAQTDYTYNAAQPPPSVIQVDSTVASLTISSVGALSSLTIRISAWSYSDPSHIALPITLTSLTIPQITIVSTSTVPPNCTTTPSMRRLQLSISQGGSFSLSLVGLALCNAASTSIASVSGASVRISALTADNGSRVALTGMLSASVALIMPLTISRSSSLTLGSSQYVSLSLEAALSGGNNALSLSGNSSMVVASNTLRSQLPVFSGISGNVSRWQSSGSAALVAATLTSNSSLRIESNTCATQPCSVRLMLLSLSCSSSPQCVVMRSNTLDARGAASQAALFTLVYAAMTLEVATTMVASGGSSVSLTSNTLWSDYRAQYVSVGSSVALSGGSSLVCSGNTVVGYMTTAVDGALSLQGVVVVLDVLFGGAVSLSGGSMVITSGNTVRTAATVANATGWWAALLRVSVASGGLQGDASGSAFAVQSNVVSLDGPLGVLSSSSCTVVVSVTISSAVLTNEASVSVDGNQISSQGATRRCGLLVEHLGAVRVSSSSVATVSRNVVRLPSLGVASSAYATAMMFGWLFGSTLAADSGGMLQMMGNSATVDTKSGASSIALGPTTMYGVAVVVSGMTSVTSGAVVSVSQNRVSGGSGSAVLLGVAFIAVAACSITLNSALYVDQNTVLTPSGLSCGPAVASSGALDGFCCGVVFQHVVVTLQTNSTLSLSNNAVTLTGSLSSTFGPTFGTVTSLSSVLVGVATMGSRGVVNSGSFVVNNESTHVMQYNTVTVQASNMNAVGLMVYAWSTLSASSLSSIVFLSNTATATLSASFSSSTLIASALFVPAASSTQAIVMSFGRVMKNILSVSVAVQTGVSSTTVFGCALGWHGALQVSSGSSLLMASNAISASCFVGSTAATTTATVVGVSMKSLSASVVISGSSQISIEDNTVSLGNGVIGVLMAFSSGSVACTATVPAALALLDAGSMSVSYNTVQGPSPSSGASPWYGIIISATSDTCTAMAMWRGGFLTLDSNTLTASLSFSGGGIYLEFTSSFYSALSPSVKIASGDASGQSYMNAATVVLSRGSIVMRSNQVNSVVAENGIELYFSTGYTYPFTLPMSILLSQGSQLDVSSNVVSSAAGQHGVQMSMNFAPLGSLPYQSVVGAMLPPATVTGSYLWNASVIRFSKNNLVATQVGIRLYFATLSPTCFTYTYGCTRTECTGSGSSTSCYDVPSTCSADHCDNPGTSLVYDLGSRLAIESNVITLSGAARLGCAVLLDRCSARALSASWLRGSQLRIVGNMLYGTGSLRYGGAAVNLFRCIPSGVSTSATTTTCPFSSDSHTTQPATYQEAVVTLSGKSVFTLSDNYITGNTSGFLWTTQSTAVYGSSAIIMERNTVYILYNAINMTTPPLTSCFSFDGSVSMDALNDGSVWKISRTRCVGPFDTAPAILTATLATSSRQQSVSMRCDSVDGAFMRYATAYPPHIRLVNYALFVLFRSCTSTSFTRTGRHTSSMEDSRTDRISTTLTKFYRRPTRTRSKSGRDLRRTPSATSQESKVVSVSLTQLNSSSSVTHRVTISDNFRSSTPTNAETPTMPLASQSWSHSYTRNVSETERVIDTHTYNVTPTVQRRTHSTSVTLSCAPDSSDNLLMQSAPLWASPPHIVVTVNDNGELLIPLLLLPYDVLVARTAAFQTVLQNQFVSSSSSLEGPLPPLVAVVMNLSLVRRQPSTVRASDELGTVLGVGNVTISSTFGSNVSSIAVAQRHGSFSFVDGEVLEARIFMSPLSLPQDRACLTGLTVPAFTLQIGTALSSAQLAVRSATTVSSTIAMVFQLFTGDGGNDMQSLVLVGMMACTPRGPMQNGFSDLRVLAPLLLEATFESVIWSNLLLLAVVLGAQCAVMVGVALYRRHVLTEEEVVVSSERHTLEDDDDDDDTHQLSNKKFMLDNKASSLSVTSLYEDRPPMRKDAVAVPSIDRVARFPGILMSAFVFTYQGTLFAAIRLMQQNSSSHSSSSSSEGAGDAGGGGGASTPLLALGSIASVLLFPLPIAVYMLSTRIHRSYHTYLVKLGRSRQAFSWRYRLFSSASVVEPIGVMLPSGLGSTWGPLVAASLPHPMWTAMPLAGGWLMCTAALLQFYHERAYCTSIFVLLALCNFVLCGATLYYRPRRSTMINIIAAVQLAVCGTTLLVCAASAYDAKYGGGDTVMALLGFSQSGLSMITTVATLCVVFGDHMHKRRGALLSLMWAVGPLSSEAEEHQRRSREYAERKARAASQAGISLPVAAMPMYTPLFMNNADDDDVEMGLLPLSKENEDANESHRQHQQEEAALKASSLSRLIERTVHEDAVVAQEGDESAPSRWTSEEALTWAYADSGAGAAAGSGSGDALRRALIQQQLAAPVRLLPTTELPDKTVADDDKAGGRGVGFIENSTTDTWTDNSLRR